MAREKKAMDGVEVAEKTTKKKGKKVLTREQKLKKKRTHLIVWTSIFSVIFLFLGITGIVTKVGSDALLEQVNKVTPVDYTGVNRITPVLDANGKPEFNKEKDCFTFYDKDGELSRRNFKVLQLTDIHIGGGAFAIQTDKWTVKTVEDLIKQEKPDLVTVTGDIAYPVFFQSATLNNKKEARIFATLMERLGVYWTFEFGNHDTELYSSYDREDIGAFYADLKGENGFNHCLFTNRKAKTGAGKDVFGVGNFAINIEAQDHSLVHTMFMMDSNSYTDKDKLGMKWDYDKIHDDQIEWYNNYCEKNGLTPGSVNKSTMYFHIPINEFKTTFESWLDQGAPDKGIMTPDKKIILCDGIVGEHGKGALGSAYTNDLYDKMVKNGTTGVFCGHDHRNNSSYLLDKDGIGEGMRGVKLTYGMSVDYLAYPGIYKDVVQRGGRVIEINKSGSIFHSENSKAYGFTADELNRDQEFGFITYNVPYKYDLYRGKPL